MMHGNATPDDPPPGNPSSVPGWNSQWSLEHQQFYYVNTSTGERRWYLPTVTTPPQNTQAKPETPAQSPTAVYTQKIQRKAVGAQSVHSNQNPPALVSQNVQANTGSVRAPAPTTDSYFPTSAAPVQYQAYQAPQVSQPLTPAPTPVQYQPPQQSQAAQSTYQQLDFGGQFASRSLEHKQANSTGAVAPPAQYQAYEPPQDVQSPSSISSDPISPMTGQPNAHNFSSQSSIVSTCQPLLALVHRAPPTSQSSEQNLLPASHFAVPTQTAVVESLLPAPLAVVRRQVPPPPPRNQPDIPQSYQRPPENSQGSAPITRYALYHSGPSPLPGFHQQGQANAIPPPQTIPATQQYSIPPVPGAYPSSQQVQSTGTHQTPSYQQYPPPAQPGTGPRTQQNGAQMQTGPPLQHQHVSPTQSPAGTQYSFPPPPPVNQQTQQGSEALRRASQPGGSAYPSTVQSPAQYQSFSTQPVPSATQTPVFPPPSTAPRQQDQQQSPIQSTSPQTHIPAQTPYNQQCNNTDPTSLPPNHYQTASVPAQNPYQPPPRNQHQPSAPPLHRYSSAPETVTHQQFNGIPQSGFPPPPPSGPARNPYAQQVAHANLFYGPPPQRRAQSAAVGPSNPVHGQAQPQVQNAPQYQHPQDTYSQPPGTNFTTSQHQQQQAQRQGQPQVQYQTQAPVQNGAQYQYPNQAQQQPGAQPQYQQHPSYSTQQQPSAQTRPTQAPHHPSYTTTKPSSTLSMSSMSKRLSSYTKTATDATKRFSSHPSFTQPALKKWGTRAAVGIVAVGALALGVDAVGDAGSAFFEGGGGDLGGGEGMFGGGEAVGGGGEGMFGGGEDVGGGDSGGYDPSGESVEANAARLEMEQLGRDNASMLLDPVGTEYEYRTAEGVNALI